MPGLCAGQYADHCLIPVPGSTCDITCGILCCTAWCIVCCITHLTCCMSHVAPYSSSMPCSFRCWAVLDVLCCRLPYMSAACAQAWCSPLSAADVSGCWLLNAAGGKVACCVALWMRAACCCVLHPACSQLPAIDCPLRVACCLLPVACCLQIVLHAWR